MAQPQVLRLIRFEQVEGERLEKQAAVKDITRAHIVAMALHQIRRHGVELNAAAGLLFVPPDLKFHIVAFKFSLDYFRHLDVFAFQVDVSVTRDRVIVDRKQNVARL